MSKTSLGNIYLSGFMGTGKSTIGRVLAKRLKKKFIDADAVIARKAGRSIAEIFKSRGERAFREMERLFITKVSRERGRVVALGGGALLSPESRRLVRASGVLVNLTCAERELWSRLRTRLERRPLLNGTRPRVHLRRLIERRRRVASGDLTVSTSRRSPHDAAKLIARRLNL